MTVNESKIIVKAVGDLSPGDFAVDGFGVGALTRIHGCGYPFKKLNGVLKGADLLICNLEGVLSTRCYDEHLRFGGLPEMAQALKNEGFNIVTVANNHAFEHGAALLKESIHYCEKAGLQICGLRDKGPYYSKPIIIEKKGTTIGILAYNWVGISDQYGVEQYLATISDGLVNYTWDRDKEKDILSRQLVDQKNIYVFRDVERLKKAVDVVILLPHWGYEWTIFPPYGVVLEARAFIDAGVDIIIGSHPHVAQGIEVYKNKVIAYSLGNFLFDPQPEKSFYGMVFECEIGKNTFKKYDYLAISCDERCQPSPASDREQKELKKAIYQSTKEIISDFAKDTLDDDLIYKKYENGYNKRKIKKIKYLFLATLKKPSMVKPILRKSLTLFALMIQRLKGQKTRW